VLAGSLTEVLANRAAHQRLQSVTQRGGRSQEQYARIAADMAFIQLIAVAIHARTGTVDLHGSCSGSLEAMSR
jgi:hypothetical protein